MSIEMEDATGTPRPARDIEAALKWAEAEIIHNPMRMGSANTGPAVMHLMVIRDVLRDALVAGGRVTALVRVLLSLEWQGQSLSEISSPECPACGGTPGQGHGADCYLDAALTAGGLPPDKAGRDALRAKRDR